MWEVIPQDEACGWMKLVSSEFLEFGREMVIIYQAVYSDLRDKNIATYVRTYICMYSWNGRGMSLFLAN